MLVEPTETLIKKLSVIKTNMIGPTGEESILRDNTKMFLKSAKMVYGAHDFTSATILYFKALFSILDLIILTSTGRTPKDHSERFRILESRFPKLYALLDLLYPTYRDTYTIQISKEICDRVKENVERIAKEKGICEGD